MVKKSRRQREGTERVYPYNVVGQDMSGQNTDSVETSVACDESSSTGFKPEATKSRRLRLEKNTSKYKSSKQERPSEGLRDCDTGHPHYQLPAMHAVANGERMEAFSSANKNGTQHDTDHGSTTGSELDSHLVETPSETGQSPDESCSDALSGKKTHKGLYNKPCPKSKKLKDSVPNVETDKNDRDDDAAEQSTKDVETQEQPQAIQNALEHDSELVVNVPETDAGIPETEAGILETEAGILETEAGIPETEAGIPEETEDEVPGTDVVEEDIVRVMDTDDSGEVLEEDEDAMYIAEDDELNVQDSSQGPVNGHADRAESEHGNEGIVTEPEDHADRAEPEDDADQESGISDPDVTISFLDGEDDRSDVDCENKAKDASTEDLPGTSEPLIEFPMDSPGKSSKSSYLNDAIDSDIDDTIETGPAMNENLPKPDEPMEDSSNTSAERGFKILHRLRNPTHYPNTQTVIKDSENIGNTTEELSKERERDFSFGRSLRSLSGRRTLKPAIDDSEPDDSFASTDTSYPTFFNFSFGKRKAEDVPKEHEPKKAKVEEGVDSLGFFARLTSPVINRLRGIKVGWPVQTTSPSGEEVNKHEEMPVALIAAPPASKRCVLM